MKVRGDGTITRVMDLQTGHYIPFEISPDNESYDDPVINDEDKDNVDNVLGQDELEGSGEIFAAGVDVERVACVERFGRTAHFTRAFCLSSVRDDTKHLFPQSVVWELDANAPPSRDSFPIDFTCSSGISVIEIELPNIENTLSDTWFTDARTQDAYELVTKCNDAETGFASEPDLLHFLSRYTHHWLEKDEFLCPFNDSESFEYMPAVTEKDFVGIFVSTWSAVEPRIKHEMLHNDMQPSHFYIVVRSGASDEQSDQLRFTAQWYGETGRSWRDFAFGEEVTRAREIGRAKRISMITRVCEALDVIPKGEVSHTETNVFGESDDENRVFYYAGASNSMEAGPGRAIMVNDGTNNPDILWLHGIYNGMFGGGQWRADQAAHGVPECIASMEHESIEALTEAGFDPDFGFAQLFHVKDIFRGEDIPNAVHIF